MPSTRISGVECVSGNEYAIYVLLCLCIQSRYRKLEYFKCYKYAIYVLLCFCIQSRYRKWDVSQVTNMEYMFYYACIQSRYRKWECSGHKYAIMFLGASTFNQNINRWAVGSGTTLTSMFAGSGITDTTYGFSVPTPFIHKN